MSASVKGTARHKKNQAKKKRRMYSSSSIYFSSYTCTHTLTYKRTQLLCMCVSVCAFMFELVVEIESEGLNTSKT